MSDIGMTIINHHIMKDQNSIPKEDQDQRWNRALDIFIESVHKPDHALRGCAHNQKCYNELMWIRDDIIEHLRDLRR
jgi:AMMECR1 domain-containing protein